MHDPQQSLNEPQQAGHEPQQQGMQEPQSAMQEPQQALPPWLQFIEDDAADRAGRHASEQSPVQPAPAPAAPGPVHGFPVGPDRSSLDQPTQMITPVDGPAMPGLEPGFPPPHRQPPALQHQNPGPGYTGPVQPELRAQTGPIPPSGVLPTSGPYQQARPAESAPFSAHGQGHMVERPHTAQVPPASAPAQYPPAHGTHSAAPQPGPAQPPAGLDDVALLRRARKAPSRGWRRAVHTLTGGAINPGQSAGELEYAQLVEQVRRPVRGDYRIAVLSLKGGVGKTTTTVGLGATFASLRGDRVIAVDANPDLGTLGQRVPQQTRSTVRDLLADPDLHRYSDVRAHTSQGTSRLEILASERDPATAETFDEREYRGVMTVLQRFYNIIITDCGTGLSHSAMKGVLDLANAVILVSSPAIDGARSASATLDWLESHDYGHLVPRSVVVLSSARPGSSTIDVDQLTQHFLTRCRAVHEIPFDDHLAEGAEVDLELVGKNTRRALMRLASTIADDFGGTTMHREEPFFG